MSSLSAEELSEADALLAMVLSPGLGPRRIQALVAQFGSAAAAWRARRTRTGEVAWEKSVGARLAAALESGPPMQRVAAEKERLARLGARVLALGEPDYPARLCRLTDPPPVLFCLGELPLAEPGVAIVGSRRASENGCQAAYDLAFGLAAGGTPVISGLARGIDAAAHAGAVAARGVTVAVLGCGLDVPYPPEHVSLAASVAAQGALVSEFPCGTPPDRQHFPRRNRLIAALATAVVVVEAPIGSGALITADYALHLGVDVYAVPGDAARASCRGSNGLLVEGAKPVLDAEHVWNEMRYWPARMAGGGREEGRAILEALADGPRTVDSLASALGWEAGRALAALSRLELAGAVQRTLDQRFALPERRRFRLAGRP